MAFKYFSIFYLGRLQIIGYLQIIAIAVHLSYFAKLCQQPAFL